MSSTTPTVAVSTAVPGSEVEFWSFVLSSRLASTNGITPSSLPEEREHAQRIVLSEMKAFQRMASAAGRRYNAMSKIAILPLEILTNVFLFCAANDFTNPQPIFGKEAIGSIVRVSHVCHTWRELALRIPKIWTSLHSWLSPRWIQEMKDRAHSAPLNVVLDHAAMCHKRTVQYISQLFPRLENVVFHGSNDCIGFLRTFMPLLLSLEIRYFDSFEAIIPLQLFMGSAPGLRRIVLTGVDFRLPVGIKRMDNLILFKIRTTIYPFKSIKHLRHLFGNMPNLQILTLQHYKLPPRPSQVPEAVASSREECLLLPPLADFTLEVMSSTLMPLLAAFRIAPGTNVALHHLWESMENDVDEAALCTFLSAWIEDWSGEAESLAARISFDTGIRPGFKLVGFRRWMIELKRSFDEGRVYSDADGHSGTGTSDGVHPAALAPKFSYQASDYHTPRECVLAAILRPRGLRALTIYGSADDGGLGSSKPRWQKVFEECHNIEHLCLTAADWLVHFIREWRTDGVLFPNLKTLWIRNVDLTAATLSRAGAVDPTTGPLPDWVPTLASQMVLERLIEQQRSSKPLDILYLMDSTVPEGWVEQLKSVVTVRLGHGDSQAPSCMRFGPARK
ncbi:hypothetical protein EVG20_g1819 [Dentipellis fragilis]|uniref:F-box domain-containing protein n=1 Tax=Dentipellis fragilis TaxID=205917 RepID=A0A4Y9Z8T4_9AGAM|nr:hypothetical protein EVG20_g1819 [Dentipellis fragilis]